MRVVYGNKHTETLASHAMPVFLYHSCIIISRGIHYRDKAIIKEALLDVKTRSLKEARLVMGNKRALGDLLVSAMLKYDCTQRQKIRVDFQSFLYTAAMACHNDDALSIMLSNLQNRDDVIPDGTDIMFFDEEQDACRCMRLITRMLILLFRSKNGVTYICGPTQQCKWH